MQRRLRKAALTAHVLSSVGWFGALAAVLALALVAEGHPERAAAAYTASRDITVFLIVPLAVGALVGGIVQGLITQWGVARHYWVLAKLVLTVIALGVLIAQTGPLGDLAARAEAGRDVGAGGASLILHSAGGLVLLTLAAGLSIFKPPGLTRRGWRRQQALLSDGT